MCKTAAMVKKNLAAVELLEPCVTLLQWHPQGTSGTFFPYFCAEKNAVMEELKRIKLFAGYSDESLGRLMNQPCHTRC